MNAKLIKIIQSIQNLKKYISENEQIIYSGENAKEGLSVPEIIMRYGGNSRKSFKEIKAVMPTMIRTLFNVKKSYSSVKRNPKENNKIASEKFIYKLVEYAKSLGVSDIGFAKVDSDLIFKNRGILYDNAIVVTMEMKKEFIDKAPGIETGKEVFRTYLGLGIIVNKIADYLRKNGFKAQAGPALGGDVIYPLLAEKAGLGAIGRHGLLISPNYGPRQRIAAIYTNIENLPFSTENKHMWIKEFCAKCGKCIRKCPGDAIYENPIVHEDGSLTFIDYRKCAVPFANTSGCTVCIKECVFNQFDYCKLLKNKSYFSKKDKPI